MKNLWINCFISVLLVGAILFVGCEKPVVPPVIPNEAPTIPSDPSPADSAIGISISVTLSWFCIDFDEDLLIYDILFGTEEDSLIVISADQTETSYVLSLEYRTTYYWKIIAEDDHGNSTPGPIWSFTTVAEDEKLIIATWNVRGYPETDDIEEGDLSPHTIWFHQQLEDLKIDILCVQEIANQERVNKLLVADDHFSKVAFQNSSDGKDNAIFCGEKIFLDDIADPGGFQHPAQAAYIAYRGFDAFVVTVHLSWDVETREAEKQLLPNIVTGMTGVDPDLIIAGDFNTKEDGMNELAVAIGMVVMENPEQTGVGTTHAGNRYDYFLISRDLAEEEACSTRIITYTGIDSAFAQRVSDHLPVLAWFSVNESYRDRSEPGTIETMFVGTPSGSKYHLSSCQYVQGRDNLREFNTKEEAEAAGLMPCSVCNP